MTGEELAAIAAALAARAADAVDERGAEATPRWRLAARRPELSWDDLRALR
jgi:thiamine biosynthesis protein ThiC